MQKPEYQELIESPEQLPALGQLIRKGLQAGPVVVTLGRKKRSSDQNRKLWPMLSDLSKQVEINNSKYNPEQWKIIMMKHWSDQTKTNSNGVELLPEFGGGGLFYAARSSKLNKKQFSELIETIYQAGAENGVRWSEPALKIYEEMQNEKQRSNTTTV